VGTYFTADVHRCHQMLPTKGYGDASLFEWGFGKIPLYLSSMATCLSILHKALQLVEISVVVRIRLDPYIYSLLDLNPDPYPATDNNLNKLR